MTDVFDDLAKAFKAEHDAGRSESADEIERLREAVKSTSTIIKLLCQCFDVEPENFITHVKAVKENGETRVVKSISAQEVLDEARAALGEKE